MPGDTTKAIPYGACCVVFVVHVYNIYAKHGRYTTSHLAGTGYGYSYYGVTDNKQKMAPRRGEKRKKRSDSQGVEVPCTATTPPARRYKGSTFSE